MSEAVPALSLSNLTHSFTQAGGAARLQVLRGIDLQIAPGEMVALVGPSGAGKSTLLHIAGLLEAPEAGRVAIGGQDCTALSDPERTLARRQKLGFVYQFHHLLPEFTALENIMLPQMIRGLGKAESRARARELLAMVNLGERESHRPGKLSGGEQQRVAIVRAIANVPKLLLADEPTGNLDPDTAALVFEQLQKISKGAELAALVATHNLELAARMDRIVTLREGHLEHF